MKAFVGLLFCVLCLGVVETALAQGNVVLLGLRSVEGDDDFANTLTDALREQAQEIEAWEMSDRAVSLTQMSLAYGCEEFDAACMSEITAGLKADAVIYGTVQRTSARDDFEFNVTLNIFSGQTGRIENTVSDLFPSTEMLPGEMAVKAKQLLLRLSGAGATQGSILIRANVETADVVVDGQPVGSIEDGSLLLDNVQPGMHEVEINNSGYLPFKQSVNVVEGEQAAVLGILRTESGEAASLLPYDVGPEEPGPSLEWLGWTLVGVSGGFLTGTIVSWVWIDSIENDSKFKDYRRRVGESDPTVQDVCVEADGGYSYALPDTTAYEDFKDVQAMCDRADVLEVLQWVFLGSAVAAGGVGAYLLITEMGSERERAESRAPTLVLKPEIGPNASRVTATLRF
jgi:hypothetical protein